MDDGVGARREGTAIPYGTYTDGALVLNSCSMDVPMSAVASELGSRTLEAWIALTNVNQRGSGFFGLQMDPAQQDQFDSIVYGEQAPQVWMTGSNNHARTPDHDPTATLESGHDGFNANAFVHIAITYNINGAVAIYRNGAVYRGPANAGVVAYDAATNSPRFYFGKRHGTCRGRAVGKIDCAAVYGSALSADEVAASYSRGCCGLARELQEASIGCCAAGTHDVEGECQDTTVCGPGQRMAVAGTATTDRQCAACLAGTFSTGNNVETCSPCTQGHYCPGGTAQLPCGAGTYNNRPRAAQCTPCGEAAHSSDGSTACRGINPGSYGVGGTDSNHTSVAACEPGYYCPGGATDRIACEPDTFAVGSGATGCDAMAICMEGSYARYLGTPLRDRTCAACPAGQFADRQNARICRTLTTCRPGTYVAIGTESGQQDRVCQACPAGSFSAGTNAPECQRFTECPAGQISTGLPSASADRSCATAAQACTATQYQSDFDGVSRYCRDLLPPCRSRIQYEIAAPTTTTNRLCERTTVCQSTAGAAEVEVTAPTATADRVCQPLCSTCPAGSYETAACDEGRSRPNTCAPCTPCGATSFVSVPCTSSSDRACTPKVTGSSRPTNGVPRAAPRVEATAGGDLAILPGGSGAAYVYGNLFMAAGAVNVGETIAHLANTVTEMAADMAKSQAETAALRLALEQAQARIQVLERPSSA